MITYKQLSLADIFSDCQNKFENDKYEFLSLPDETIDLEKEGSKSHLRSGIPTMKFVCPKMKWEYDKNTKKDKACMPL